MLLTRNKFPWRLGTVLYVCKKYINQTNIEWIFFILEDAKYHSIYYIDVYQGKNTANTDIRPSLNNLPTTQKTVANAIIKIWIKNDPHGSRHIYMDNQYAAQQLFSLI